MSTHGHTSRRIHPEELKVDATAVPGWESADGRQLAVGDRVYCTDGPGEVVRVLGRTQSGSRLLELRLAGRRDSFFAASSNVLVPVEGAAVGV